MTTFADLETGDVFSFANHMGRESWEKTGAHQARVVNSDYTRNVASAEPVNVLFAAADRAARLRGEGAEPAEITPAKAVSPPDLITPAEAAELLRTTPMKLSDWERR